MTCLSAHIEHYVKGVVLRVAVCGAVYVVCGVVLFLSCDCVCDRFPLLQGAFSEKGCSSCGGVW